MSQIITSAKSGSHWTNSELSAYNIAIIQIDDPRLFFNSREDPALDHLDHAILTSPNGLDPNLSSVSERYLGFLGLASESHTQESAIDDFVQATLQLLGYDSELHTIVATRRIIPLTVCAEKHSAQTDVCVIHRPTGTILLAVEDKTLSNHRTNVEAQVVAEAIAAYQYNNERRRENHFPLLESMTIPCITMYGTIPTFYLVPVSRELDEAVKGTRYPTSQTQILKCVTSEHKGRFIEGMANIEFRQIALKRFIAFKGLAKSCWEQLLA